MFCLQRSEVTSREQLAIINSARKLGHGYVFADKCADGMIPIGDVPFGQAAFGQQPYVKAFYPEFLHRMRARQVILTRAAGPIRRRLFAKVATEWKSDTPARVYEIGETLPDKLLWVSDVVPFENEWRYYVADGELIATGWYDGKDDDALAPALDIEWPKGFSGAVDFGTACDQLLLVEAHAPFACGWYGDDPELFALWQAIAWDHRDFWRAQDAD